MNTNQQEVENLKARDSFSLNIKNLDTQIDQKGHHVTEAEANKEETNSFRNQSSVAGSNYLMQSKDDGTAMIGGTRDATHT